MLIDAILTNLYYTLWGLSAIFSELEIPTENVTVTYTIHTPENPHPTIINELEDVEINPEHEIKILCHGNTFQNYTTQWYNFTIDEYMEKGNVSVIAVFYGQTLRNVETYKSLKYAAHIGRNVGNFTLKLNTVKGVEFERVHIIAHMMGAHVAGVAGETVYAETGKYIDRITAIDPSNPGYLNFPMTSVLNKHNAKFVDVIYINNFALQKPLGRIDFHGQWYMARCATYKKRNWQRQLGPLYYANSINGKHNITATKCVNKFGNFFSRDNCLENVTTVLGEYVDREAFGQYYLNEKDIVKYACETEISRGTGI